MSAREKSVLPVVAEKRANKAALAAADFVERRGRPKENAERQSTVRTQSRAVVSQALARIRTIGIVRAKAKIDLQNLLYNIRRLVTLEWMAAT